MIPNSHYIFIPSITHYQFVIILSTGLIYVYMQMRVDFCSECVAGTPSV